MNKLYTTRVLLLTVIASFITILVSAQQPTPVSRLAVVASEAKTTIWVSDFPKSTSVVLFDEEDNLLSIVSTNEYGAAFISLPKSITTTIFAKTMNGEITVSNKIHRKNTPEEQIALADQSANASKA